MSTATFVRQHGADLDTVRSYAFVICIITALFISAAMALSHINAKRQLCGIELNEKVNPNSAPAASMARLPGIGVAKALAIENYRRSSAADSAEGAAFKDAKSLQRVKGIGPKTVMELGPWLTFE